MKVITCGRTDLDEYFKLSGIREHKKLVHSPFLIFLISGDSVEVRIVDNAKALLDFADGTQVMAQWKASGGVPSNRLRPISHSVTLHMLWYTRIRLAPVIKERVD